MSLEHLLRDEEELLKLFLQEAERDGEFQMRKYGIRYWMRHFRMTIDLWNIYTNKIGQVSHTISCYDDHSQHEFYF